jgi:hypothetical protein
MSRQHPTETRSPLRAHRPTSRLGRGTYLVLGMAALLGFGLTVPSAFAGTRQTAAATAAGKTGGVEVAPYVDLGLLSNGGSLADLSKQSGLKEFTLAFTNGNGCTPTFPATTEFVKQQVADLRAAGGDVKMSFGGATGVELAGSCTDPAQLEAAYAGVAADLGITAFDMDIEGAAIADAAAIDRRSKALASLQRKMPGLRVSLTLPVLATGLTDGVNVVKSAKDNGLDVDVVNIMAMDYGANDTGDRGDEALQATKATLEQVRGILGADTSFARIGVTPMLGENDDHAIFDLDDARQLVAFARANGVGYLGFWELNRDKNACTGALFQCTNIPQQPLEFARIFAGG